MARVSFVTLILFMVVVGVLRTPTDRLDPAVEIVGTDGTRQTVTLSTITRAPVLTRVGRYQNQYGNWRDEGIYSGVLVSYLLRDKAYTAVEAVSQDGYRVRIDRSRIEDPAYPMVLAYAFNGVTVPDWEDGFRIAVLPESGGVSNTDYGMASAGSVWIKQVVRLVLHP